jgi:UDPglucose 6-dehydrogenase
MTTLSVIGVGYLGAVHAVCMAELGHTVIGLDVDSERVASLNAGRAPFFEPGFQELLDRSLASGRLRFTTDYADLAEAEVHFLALGTPQRADSHAADLSFLQAAVASLAGVLADREQPAVLVGKSTVPVGTARTLARQLRNLEHLELIWNPEFLREGHAVADTLHPDRLIYGTADGTEAPTQVAILDRVYAPLLASDIPRLVFNFETAELVKVSANSLLATKISFINAIAEVCEASGADVTQVARAIGLDPRIGPAFLAAGVGFGGGCLPKDIRAFSARSAELGATGAVGLLEQVDAINLGRRQRVIDLVAEALPGAAGAAPAVTVLGAAFKPNSDDVRDSPALDIACRLRAAGYDVTVHDPQALANVRRRFPDLRAVDDLDEALAGARVVLLLTEWQDYRPGHLAASRAAGLMAPAPVVIDGRNALDRDEWEAAGFTFHGLGR